MMNEQKPIRVVIADDQDLVCTGFSMVINSQPDLTVVGQAGNGIQAVQLVRDLNPDVILMDVRMPDMNGIEATKAITELTDTTRVIILTTFDLDEYVMSAIEAGASGFLLKDVEPEGLLNAIRTIHEGNAIIAPSATKRLIQHMSEHPNFVSEVNGSTTRHSSTNLVSSNNSNNSNGASASNTTEVPAEEDYRDPELATLTARELEVLIEIAHGLSNQEIADKLFISLPTVKTHVGHLFSKINARDRVQAVVFAYENKLV